VGSAGTTAYELACAGVPSVLLVVADNQAGVARSLAAAGISLSVDARSGLDHAGLESALGSLADPLARRALAEAGPARIDGYGAFRARDALRAAWDGRPLPRVLRYRPATRADSELLLAWRNDPVTRASSLSEDPVDRPGHESWLADALRRPDRVLLVVEDPGGGPAGTVRFDLGGEAEAVISVTVAPERRGSGIARQAVREAAELLLAARPDVPRVRAEIRDDNPASRRAFERAGYRPAPEPAGPGLSALVLER
jgi:RimJ/RimL family protein N-acetyltransferase